MASQRLLNGIMVLALATLIAPGCTKKKTGYGSVIDSKVDSVLALMTLEEKIGQLTLYTSDMDQTGAYIRKEYEDDIKKGRVGAIFNAYGAEYTRKLQEMAISNSRLRIPLIFGYDVIHGHKTIFPIPIAEASSWDTGLVEKSARVAAREATAQGLHWTFAPMCDIARDPRWGRIMESSGEDPYLGSLMAQARVKGFQGDNLGDSTTLVACVKHFAAYGGAQAGRDYHSVDMSERTLREIYLPPYRAAIDAGAETVMTSFNDLNGIPVTSNSFLLTQILRNEWGFKGFVVTDYTAIMELLYHGVAADTLDAALQSFNAGVDMDMQSGFYQQSIIKLYNQNKISGTQLNDAVRRVLRVKFMLGLFDDPFRYCSPQREKDELMSVTNQEVARDVARKSIVLLKNQNKLLPLGKYIKSIAVIGPLANSKQNMIGSWSAAGDWSQSITLLEGIKSKIPSAKIMYSKGCNINDDSTNLFNHAVNIARQADVVVLAIGEAAWMSGEAASRAHINLPGVQQQLAERLYQTGKPIVVVLMNGRPLTIGWISKNIPAILETWFLGTQAGNAIADVLFGDYNPSGKLPVTFPRSEGQIPIYYSMRNTGRPIDPNNKYTSKYLDESNTPLYPFGYGLSYTTFNYSDVELSSTSITPTDTLTVSIKITNTGKYDGSETVQLYLHDNAASVAPPVKLLKGVQKAHIKAGETKSVTFKVSIDDLMFYRANMTFGFEKGAFTVFVGGNSSDTKSSVFSLI